MYLKILILSPKFIYVLKNLHFVAKIYLCISSYPVCHQNLFMYLKFLILSPKCIYAFKYTHFVAKFYLYI